MTQEDKDKYNYRFGGYQLPLIILDSTGPAYVLKFWTHPYYVNQPTCWKKPIYDWGGVIIDKVLTQASKDALEAQQFNTTTNLYPFVPISKK